MVGDVMLHDNESSSRE